LKSSFISKPTLQRGRGDERASMTQTIFKVSKHHNTILIDIWFQFFAIIFDITMFLGSFKIQLYFLRILIYFFGNSKYILNKVVWKLRKKMKRGLVLFFFSN